jgi:hypothetical protein
VAILGDILRTENDKREDQWFLGHIWNIAYKSFAQELSKSVGGDTSFNRSLNVVIPPAGACQLSEFLIVRPACRKWPLALSSHPDFGNTPIEKETRSLVQILFIVPLITSNKVFKLNTSLYLNFAVSINQKEGQIHLSTRPS